MTAVKALRAKPSFVLQDGATLDDLINVDTHEVSLRVMSDSELHRLEMERIFAKTWLLLGHETEIPKAGDFVIRDMGEDNVIVARSNQGKIHVSLNVCPHRGMRVCRAEAGNAQVHQCVYHGWAFRPNGDFAGSPVEKEQMHGSMMAKSELGLRQARVELYGGLIFATWNIDGPSLQEHLGDIKYYLDQLFCRTDSGMEMLGPPQRFEIPCNWKVAAEQSGSDGYHALTLHRFLIESGMNKGEEGSIHENVPGAYGVDVAALQGHTLRCMDVAQIFQLLSSQGYAKKSVQERLLDMPPAGLTPELVPQLQNHLSPAQIEQLATLRPTAGGIFPNILVGFFSGYKADGSGITGLMSLHSYVPKGPDKMEFVNFIFAEKDAPESHKRDMLEASAQTLGLSGLVEQDDSDVWPYIFRSARGTIGRQSTLKYQALVGHNPPKDWAGPGLVFPGFSKDDTQWVWWMAYHRMMASAA